MGRREKKLNYGLNFWQFEIDKNGGGHDEHEPDQNRIHRHLQRKQEGLNELRVCKNVLVGYKTQNSLLAAQGENEGGDKRHEKVQKSNYKPEPRKGFTCNFSIFHVTASLYPFGCESL